MTKKKSAGMLILDILMALVFVILFNKSAFGGMAFHEIAGLCFAGGLVAHIILNRKWIAGVAKKFGSMPVRTKLEYIVALLLLVDLAVMTVSGILISKVVFAKLITAQVNASGLHTATAYLALLLMGLHIGLAWDRVRGMAKKVFGLGAASQGATVVLRIAAAAIFAFGVYSMATTNYFARAFSFTGGSEQQEMLPGGEGGFGGQLPDGQNSQNSQNDQSTQNSQNSQSTQSGGGKGGDNGQMPSGGRGGKMQGKGQLPSGDNGQRPDFDGGSGGFDHMNGGHGSSTAETAAKNLSILGAFAVLAYYLEKFFGKKKTGAPATAAPADSASDAATQSETSAVVAQSETSAAAECADAPVSDDAETAETT